MIFFSWHFPLHEFFFGFSATPPPPNHFSNGPSLTSSNRLQTILLFSAFNMVSLGKSVKVGDERSTCAVPTIKFHDVSLN